MDEKVGMYRLVCDGLDEVFIVVCDFLGGLCGIDIWDLIVLIKWIWQIELLLIWITSIISLIYHLTYF